MSRLWRLTRNRCGRVLYESLASVGVTGTVMYEYVRSLEGPVVEPQSDPGRTVEECPPSALDALDVPTDDLEPGETVLAAREGEALSGYLFLSTDTTHCIRPLERELTFEGAYLRRVYVRPSQRNRGVATDLVAAACRRAADRGAGRATALVAIDNRPSRRLFAHQGFRPQRARWYVRIGPLTGRSVRDLRDRL